MTVALAALAQALVVKLYRLRRSNLGFRIYSRALVEENKWRAARYGIDGKLIDFGKRAGSADARAGARVARVRGRRGGRAGQPEGARRTCTPSSSEGTSADRQLQVYSETGDLARSCAGWSRKRARAHEEVA